MKLNSEAFSHFTSVARGEELVTDHLVKLPVLMHHRQLRSQRPLSQGSLSPRRSSHPLVHSQSLLLEKPQCRGDILVQSPKSPEGEEGEELDPCFEMNKKL